MRKKNKGKLIRMPDNREFQDTGNRVNQVAKECLKVLFDSVPWGKQFILSTGETRVFGLDIVLREGHLEYSIAQTGWGGVPQSLLEREREEDA